jgi:hypothetical protein
VIDRKVLEFRDLKSEKLKEICLSIRAQNKQDIPYVIWGANSAKPSEPSYYHYFISASHYLSPRPFPVSETPMCFSEWETIIIDNETNEHLEIAIRSNVLVRVKASQRNPKVHFRFSEGFAEITDIRKAFLWGNNNIKHLTIFAYMSPTLFKSA